MTTYILSILHSVIRFKAKLHNYFVKPNDAAKLATLMVNTRYQPTITF